MEKDGVLIDFSRFPDNKARVEEMTSIYEKILETSNRDAKGNDDKTACVLIHSDPKFEQNSMFICGNPSCIQRNLVHALKKSIEQGAKPHYRAKAYLLNAINLLSDLNILDMKVDDKTKLELSKALATIGVIALSL